MMQIAPTSTSMMMIEPPDSVSTISVITRPMPVSVTVPTRMPAVAVAMPTAVMLRAPVASPSMNSRQPCRACAAIACSLRNSAVSGRWVRTTAAIAATPQNAARPGDISSIIRHQISTPTGSMKCRPVRAVS